jgi:hypothetical protein
VINGIDGIVAHSTIAKKQNHLAKILPPGCAINYSVDKKVIFAGSCISNILI